MDQKLKHLYEVIKRRKGALLAEDEESAFLKTVLKEIPVFKDIPNNFKLEVIQLH